MKHLIAILLASFAISSHGITLNGFDISEASVPAEQILRGGPPRDGIPAIDEPRFISASEVSYLNDSDLVLGVEIDGVQRAYPLRILVWHEIVNDQIGDRKLAVTYCPLCGTAMVFDRLINGEERRFGVSGLLYQSDVLMYDRETESLWSQLGRKSITGPHRGEELTWIPSQHMRWGAWRAKFPDSEVLSTETGFQRNYSGNAYADYVKSDRTMFPVTTHRTDLPLKHWVIGIIVKGQAKAYIPETLPDEAVIKDNVGGQDINIRYSHAARYPQVTDAHGKAIPAVLSFWFAWQAFYPDTLLWDPASQAERQQ